MEPAGERGGGGVAVADQRAGVRGRDGRGDGHPDRPAEVLRGAEQASGDSRVALGHPGEGADGDRDEGERGADAGDEERPGQVGPEAPVGRGLRCPQDPGSDERHAEGHDGLHRGPRHEPLGEARAGQRQRGHRRRQPGRTRRQRREAEHLLHVKGAQEHEGVEARPEQEADRVRSGDAAHAEEREGQEGCLDLRLDDEEQGEQDRAGGEHGDGLGGRPAHLGRLGDGVDEHQQGGGDRHGSEGVVASRSAGGAALFIPGLIPGLISGGHHLGGQGERRCADGDVEEEDVLPSGVGGENSAGQQADRPAQCAHPAPDAEGLVALGALGEHVHHDRQRSRQHERRPESLDPSHHDEEGVRGGQAAGQGGGGEDRQAGHEQAAPPEQVSGTAAEEQETGEGQPVRGHQPLQVGLGETEFAADGGQGDVHDREIHDRDEVGHDQQRERFPPLTRQLGRPAGA